MNQRFQNEDIRRVSKQYAENELYKAVSSIGPMLEAELTKFGLCSEEGFTEVLGLLTEIAEQGEAVLPEVENCWLRKFNEYRRFDRQVDEDEIRKVVGIVFGFAILAIDSSRHPFYKRTLAKQLIRTVSAHPFKGWASTLERIFSVPLPDGWFDAFIREEPEGGVSETGLPLPKSINTERAQTYFQKAIDKGYMKLEDGRFVWVGAGKRGATSQLAYFCGQVYEYQHSENGNVGTQFPEHELNDLFGVKRLYSLLNQVYNANNTQSWRPLIDEMFT